MSDKEAEQEEMKEEAHDVQDQEQEGIKLELGSNKVESLIRMASKSAN